MLYSSLLYMEGWPKLSYPPEHWFLQWCMIGSDLVQCATISEKQTSDDGSLHFGHGLQAVGMD